MSQERNFSMELSQEDWEELWPDLRVILDGVEEAPLRNAVAKIYATQVDSPQARENFWRVLDNPLATASTNGLKQFVKRTERVAFERAINRGLGLLRGGLAEWERLAEEGNFWSWCYQGCDSVQKEEVAKTLGRNLYFSNGSAWQALYVQGNVNASALLERLLDDIVDRSSADTRATGYAPFAGSDADRYARYEASLKSQRRTHFLNMLAKAHGDTQEGPLLGLPLRNPLSVLSLPNDGRPLVNAPSLGHSQDEEAKRKRSLGNESNLSSKRPKIAERRDYDGDNSLSLLRSKHEGNESEEFGRAGTPHPNKELDGVSRHRRCHRLVDWLRDFPHRIGASLNRRMPFLKKLGKGKRSEPSELEVENRRRHSSQSRSPGFRGGASLNLSKRRKTSSPAALFLTKKGSLRSAPDQTATSPLHVTDDPSQFRTNKYSPHSLLEMAPLQSPTPQDSPHSSPHSSPGSIPRPKPRKTQYFVDGSDEE